MVLVVQKSLMVVGMPLICLAVPAGNPACVFGLCTGEVKEGRVKSRRKHPSGVGHHCQEWGYSKGLL